MKVTFRKILPIFSVIPVLLIILSCSDDSVSADDTDKLEVFLKMEVHVVDSLYPIYSIPRTKTFLYTFKRSADGTVLNQEYSDTTTCPNGWAVKEMFYELGEGDSIYLGATIKNPPKDKYQFAKVGFEELLRFNEGVDTVEFVKTFTIFE